MKRFLPIIISCIAIIFFSRLVFGSTIHQASAQTPSVSPSPTIVVSLTPTPTTPSSLEQNQVSPAELPSDWIIDPEVTNIGKNAARAGIFLDWALQNYDWSYVQPGQANPLTSFWATIRNIVYAFLVLVVIAGSLVLIITRGRSVTLRRFIPRFLAIVILVTFSFAFVEFLYQVVDVFQGFFIRPGGVAVSQKDLLYIGWKYQPFVGLRAIGDENFESAFISLLLVKLTSFTYYAMVGILLVRKIILWFFIMVSPFFPLLLLFYPLRNTAKIWLGEFFRWLLYAPLFAIFLAGLVSLWKTGIPLLFNFSEAGKGIVFPTAISILLGGPLQRVGVANSVNLADTFGLYLVALLMLWMVIVFPFILLQIFLDYLSNINVNQNALARQFVNLLTKFPPQPPGTPPPGYQPTGLARALPFLRDFAIPKTPATTGLAREIPRSTGVGQQQKQTQQQTVVVRPVSIAQKEEVRKLTNISIPTLRDIARFESISLTKDRQTQKDRERVREMLERIANPAQNETRIERERYSSIREKLEKESESGNQLASTVLKAAQQVTSQAVSTVQNLTNITNVINHLANPASISSTPEREKYVEFRETLIKEQEKNTFASSVLSAMQTITMSSKNTLQSLAQTLSHPQEVPERLKETVFDLKETLKKESEKGQELATSVLSVFEKLESIEKVSTSLMQILHPEVVKEVSEKEHFEKVKEKLVSEKEKNNTLATTILTQAEKLTTASSISEKSQILASVKEAVTSESEKQNNLAQFISSQLPGLMQVDTTVSEEKVQVDLEKAQREGNPLAVKLLAVAQETSAEKQKEKLASLQTEIAQEKDKGNKLAIALSDMMTPKPKLAAKPEAFPTTNRIQEVSLDDYEAVKKMWTENYQNLETEDLAGKKQWIEDDVKQIADTTDLLTSEDTEKVEEGMQKVSDILPFLLIGGFSQSEIVAYLKAKQEAGKEVLSDITKQTEEEETTISVERATRVAPKTVTVSATRADDSTEVAEVVSRASVTPIAETVSLPPKLMSPVARQEATHMLRVANIAIPSLRTVASYDETRLSHDAKREQEIAKTRDALRLITNPNLAKDEVTQEHYKEIQETLAKEVEKGNHLAYSIISAGRLLGKLTAESTFTGVLQLAEVLKKLSDPSQISDEKEKEVFQKLSETISFQSNNGNAVAADVYAALRRHCSIFARNYFMLRQTVTLLHKLFLQKLVW
ncbi:MAG: hypothetical protein HYV40_01895 [Candidatus Levybacteria bacterium]|nr:hypothetical protein [Candidatus Levybacteria bacterium]